MALSDVQASTDAPSSEDTPIGRVLGERYRLESKIGAGGVGAVYRGTHLMLGQPVAVKLLLDHYGSHPALRKRFEREAKALAALSHPNIVAVTDYGLSGDTPYLVMELLEGMTLSQRLRQGRPEPKEALQLTTSLLRALSFVHEQGLVHRDLKPGNIFVQRLPDGDTRLKLLDFGLAKFLHGPERDKNRDKNQSDGELEASDPEPTLTRSGDVVGTPAYMAPEQVVGDATDARTDLYSVGIVLFAMIAGRLPFQGDPTDQLRAHLVEPLPKLSDVDPTLEAQPALEAWLARATDKARERRFQSASEMLTALLEIPEPWVRRRDAAATIEESQSSHGSLAVASTVAEVREDDKTRLYGESAKSQSTDASRGRAGRLRSALGLALVLALPWFGWSYFTREGDASRVSRAASETVLETSEATAVSATSAARATSAASATNSELSPSSPTTAAAVEPSPEAATVAPARDPAARPAAKNPWARAIPRELRSLRKSLQRGDRGNDRTISALRRYNREHPEDARGHLLLAALYDNRQWRSDVLNQLVTAYQRDPSARGAPEMLSKLIALCADGVSVDDVTRFVRDAYAAEARPALERALRLPRYDDAQRARLHALLESLPSAPAQL